MCHEAQQGSAGRRSLVEFPGRTRTHPLPRAPARSLAVGSAHSHATPQAFSLPASPQRPGPHRNPESPTTFPEPKGREAPKARQGGAGGTAWERCKAQLG